MNRIREIFRAIGRHPLVFCLVASPLVNLFIESLGRRSLFAGVSHVFFSPLVFIYNSLIIFATLSIAFLFGRKFFIIGIVTSLWIVLGIINGVVRSFRATPLAAIDFFVVKAEGEFFASYLTWWQILLIVLGVAAIIVSVVLLWKKAPRNKVKRISAAAFVLATFLAVGTATTLGMETELISDDFYDLTEAYENYGFAYCFSCSLLDTGIEKPEDYSAEAVESILDTLASRKEVKHTPDIVVVQLESFFDPAYIAALETSEPVIPNFKALAEQYPSGLLSVQSIGGGTANTEFEVLTGMNLDHFGPGEYPYMTVLSDGACESVAYDLASLGYRSHAIHNYTGVFYDRHKVYANLGFDTFTSMEYMKKLVRNPRGWVKDICLVDEISAALDDGDNTFVWAVSVQPHGAYQDEVYDCDYDIKVTGVPEEEKIPTEYYLNQLKETDDFVGALIEELSSREEPVVVLFYGDHLPPLEITDADLVGIDMHQTEYVIWSNFGLDGADRDLEAYQLSSHLFSLLGFDGGNITRLHQTLYGTDRYQNALCTLEYDMLYGKNYAGARYSPTSMRMGREDIVVTDAYCKDGLLTVKGENFTEWSRVKIGIWKKDTVCIDGNTLVVEGVDIIDGERISVVQVSDSGVTLSESNVIS